MVEISCTTSQYLTSYSTLMQYDGPICHRLAVKNYFRFR